MAHIKLSFENNIAIVTLCYPPQNRMDLQMQAELGEIIQTIRETPNVRCAVLTGEGDTFSFGGYFPEWLGLTGHQFRKMVEVWKDEQEQWERLPFPTIAAINGPCWGGAFEMALACDLIYAVPEATFNHPEKSIAIPTLLGGVYRFAERAGKNVAAEMAFTSKPLTAQRMYELNVVNHVVPREELMDTVMGVAAGIAKAPASVHEAHKSLLRLWSQGGVYTADQALMDYCTAVYNAADCARAFESARKAMEGGYARPDLDFTDTSCFR